MTQTVYDVQGNPITRTEEQSDEIFSGDELDAIQICAADIDSIVTVATNGPAWLASGQASANAAAQSAGAAANSATSATNSASAASSSAGAASSSATAAATSSQNSANSATAALASANSAATSAQDAQTAADSITQEQSLPAGGMVQQALRKASINNYDVSWQDDPLQAFLNLIDVDGSGKADNYVAYWDDATQKVKFRPPNAASTLTGLSDVNILSVQDKQYVGWDAVSGKYVNFNLPIGDMNIPTRPRVVGPISYSFSASDKGSVTDIDCLGGPVTYYYDDSVSHNQDTVVQTILNVINASPANKLSLVGGSATGPIPIPDVVQMLSATSGVLGTALTHAQNVAKAVTIPAGVTRSVYVIYAANPANGSNPSVSTGFTLAGTTYNWSQAADANNVGPRTYIGVVNLPDSSSPLGTTFKPNWTDYGGNGNVNSYIALIIPTTLVEDRAPFENNGITQQPTPASYVDSVTTIPPGKGNRRIISIAFRRGNVGLDLSPIQPSGSGVSLLFEGATSTTVTADSEMRACVATRTSLPGETDTVHFELVNTASYSEVHFTMTPVDGTMLVVGRDAIVNPAVAFDGLLEVIYNSNNKRVDVGTAPPAIHISPNDIVNLTPTPISIAGDAIVGTKMCELQQIGGVNPVYDGVWSVSGSANVRIRSPGTGPNIILEVASVFGSNTGAKSVTVSLTGGELGATVITEVVNFTVTAVIPSYIPPTDIAITSGPFAVTGSSPVGTKVVDLSLIGGVNALYNSTWSITAGPTKVRLRSPGTGQNVTVEIGTVFGDANAGTKTNTIQVTGGELGTTVLSIDVTYDVNTTPLPAAWNLYQGTNGAAITAITGGLRLKAGSGVGGYADHNQIWNTGDSYSMPYGGQIKFTITRRDNAAGTVAGVVMMLYFGTLGDLTAGHPANPSDWVGATAATRWEYSSYGMRVSWADSGGDSNTVNQVRTREFLAAGSPNQGTQKLGTGAPNTQPGSLPFVKDTTYNCVVDITGNVFTFTQTNVSSGAVKTITHTDVAYSSHQIGYMGFRTMETLDMEMTNFSVVINGAPVSVDLPAAEVTVNVANPSPAAGLTNLRAALAALSSPVTKHTDIILADGDYGTASDTLDCNANGQSSGLVMIRGKDNNYNAKLLCVVKTTGNYNVLTKLRINGSSMVDTGHHCRVTRCRRYAFVSADGNCFGIQIGDGSQDFQFDYNELTMVTTQVSWQGGFRHNPIWVVAKGNNAPVAQRYAIHHNYVHRSPAKPLSGGANYGLLYVHAAAVGNTASDSYQPGYGLLYKNVFDDLRGSDGLLEPKTSRLTIWGNTGRRWRDGTYAGGGASSGYPNQRRGKENTWISNWFDDTGTWNIMGFGHIIAGNRSSATLTLFSGDIPAGTITGSGNYESSADCWVLGHVGPINCGDSFSGSANQNNNPANVRFDVAKTALTFVSMDSHRPSLFGQTRPAVGAPTAGVVSPLDWTKQQAPGGGVPAFTAAVALNAPVLKVGGATPTEQQYITQVTTVVAGSEGDVGPWAPFEALPAWGAGITVPA